MKRPRGICKYCKCLAPPADREKDEYICMSRNTRLKKPPSTCDNYIDYRTYLEEEVEDDDLAMCK